MISLFILIAIVIVAVLLFAGSYNSFVTLRGRAQEAWADIDVQLKRRYDLIPNLVNTVKGYAAHESGTLEAVTQARNQAMSASSATPNAGNLDEKSKAETALSATLRTVFALSESYPDLKANTNFLSLQTELSDTENKIQAARRFYNGNVRDLNIKIDSFPSNIIANMFHFAKMQFFDLGDNDAAKNPVEVKF